MRDTGRIVTGQLAPEEISEGGEVREQDKARADAARAAKLAQVGVELMNAYNHGKKDPSDMAVLGHDTTTGYEFYIEPGGDTVKVSITYDLE